MAETNALQLDIQQQQGGRRATGDQDRPGKPGWPRWPCEASCMTLALLATYPADAPVADLLTTDLASVEINANGGFDVTVHTVPVIRQGA